ncbi:hypothetical protein T07_6093, partial [Trichinella nelsoni]
LECIKAVTDNSSTKIQADDSAANGNKCNLFLVCCLIWKRRISDKSSVIRIDLSVEESTVKVELIQKRLKLTMYLSKHGGYSYFIEVIIDVRLLICSISLKVMFGHANQREMEKLEYDTTTTLEGAVNCETNNGRCVKMSNKRNVADGICTEIAVLDAATHGNDMNIAKFGPLFERQNFH